MYSANHTKEKIHSVENAKFSSIKAGDAPNSHSVSED
jgi:hypothetical protein